MADTHVKRIAHEMTLAAFGVSIETFDPWVLDRLTELLDEQHVRAGQVLWSAGSEVGNLYFMNHGRVRSTCEGKPPWTFEGRWFLGSFEGRPRRPARRTLVALSDFYALTVSRQAWFDLLEDSFALTRRAIFATASTVARLDQRLPTLQPAASPPSTRVPDGPLTLVDRIAFLAEIAMARGAHVQAIADLSPVAEEVTLGQGDVLFRAGADHDSLLLVVDGEVDATRSRPDVHRRFVAGEVVAGAAALCSQAHHWTARAHTPARLLAFPVERWFDLMEEHFDLAHAALVGLAEQREVILERLAAEAGPQGLVLGDEPRSEHSSYEQDPANGWNGPPRSRGDA